LIISTNSQNGKKLNTTVQATKFINANIIGPETFVVNKKTFAAGKNIKPTNLSTTNAKGKITTFFKLLKIFLILILKLLFGSFQVIYKAIRVFIGKWTRFKD
jgi:hypothetical protein